MNEKLVMHTPDSTLNYANISKTQTAIHVKEASEHMDKLRNKGLSYMGDQNHVVCRDQKLPPRASSKRDNKYTHRNLTWNTTYAKKYYMRCFKLHCQVRI